MVATQTHARGSYSASDVSDGIKGLGGEVTERASSSDRVFTPLSCRKDRRVVRVTKVGKKSLMSVCSSMNRGSAGVVGFFMLLLMCRW